MSESSQLFLNTFLVLILNLVTKASNAIIFILIARQMGSEQSGVFSLSTTYLLLFSAITWGLDELMTRQVARDLSTSSLYFYTFLILRFFLSVILYLVALIIILYVIDYPSNVAKTILVMVLCLLPDSLRNVGKALLSAHNKFAIMTFAALLGNIVKIGGAVFFIFRDMELTGIITIWFLGSFLEAIIILIASKRIVRLPSLGWIDYQFLRSQLNSALPFLIVGFLITLEYQLDVVILSLISTETEVGWYSGAVTIVSSLAIFSQAYRVAVYPLMVQFHHFNSDKLDRLYDLSFFYLASFVIPIVLGVAVLAPRIINLVYGASFDSAVFPLRILIWSLIFTYLNVPNSRLMMADGKQGWLSIFLVMSMGSNVMLNLLLDSKMGADGAAIARLCSTCIFFIPNYLFVVLRIKPKSHEDIASLSRPVFAALCMAFVVRLLTKNLPIGVVILSGATVYIAIFFLLEYLYDKEELVNNIKELYFYLKRMNL